MAIKVTKILITQQDVEEMVRKFCFSQFEITADEISQIMFSHNDAGVLLVEAILQTDHRMQQGTPDEELQDD